MVYGKINIELPDGKTSIVGNAFNGCIALTSINIPSSIKNIGFKAFWHCKSLHEVTMNWNTQQLDWLELYKDSSILGDDGNIVNVYIPKGLIDQYKMSILIVL